MEQAPKQHDDRGTQRAEAAARRMRMITGASLLVWVSTSDEAASPASTQPTGNAFMEEYGRRVRGGDLESALTLIESAKIADVVETNIKAGDLRWAGYFDRPLVVPGVPAPTARDVSVLPVSNETLAKGVEERLIAAERKFACDYNRELARRLGKPYHEATGEGQA